MVIARYLWTCYPWLWVTQVWFRWPGGLTGGFNRAELRSTHYLHDARPTWGWYDADRLMDWAVNSTVRNLEAFTTFMVYNVHASLCLVEGSRLTVGKLGDFYFRSGSSSSTVVIPKFACTWFRNFSMTMIYKKSMESLLLPILWGEQVVDPERHECLEILQGWIHLIIPQAIGIRRGCSERRKASACRYIVNAS